MTQEEHLHLRYLDSAVLTAIVELGSIVRCFLGSRCAEKQEGMIASIQNHTSSSELIPT